ncbi:hypothetical protein P691DRAFT_781270 [Macrolepiota fuliginosa MF-IS2]|uniref:Uncharacterized protein n=1 Tax=Macrolepiota fuliginosa MF-IS2 TaxID=1400762 RepID=A0A9P5WZK6_9AGAR|nr:hypothetical protein P691DRAFT_781270 [Macrolepiota fuliginosa MF-IS2]
MSAISSLSWDVLACLCAKYEMPFDGTKEDLLLWLKMKYATAFQQPNQCHQLTPLKPSDTLLEIPTAAAPALSNKEATEIWYKYSKMNLGKLVKPKLLALLSYHGIPEIELMGLNKPELVNKIQAMRRSQQIVDSDGRVLKKVAGLSCLKHLESSVIIN